MRKPDTTSSLDDLLDQPIVTLEQARALYVAMGCNGYYIWRESSERSEEFGRLVPRELQVQWRLEEFERIRDALPFEPEPDRYSSFRNLLNLSDWSRAAIEDILAAANHLLGAVSPTDALLAAEDLLARNALEVREGASLRSFDNGYRDLARQLLDVTAQLLAIAAPDGKYVTMERIDAAKDRMGETAKLINPTTPSLAQRIQRWFGR